jgi:hypothetical protein
LRLLRCESGDYFPLPAFLQSHDLSLDAGFGDASVAFMGAVNKAIERGVL